MLEKEFKISTSCALLSCCAVVPETTCSTTGEEQETYYILELKNAAKSLRTWHNFKLQPISSFSSTNEIGNNSYYIRSQPTSLGFTVLESQVL